MVMDLTLCEKLLMIETLICGYNLFCHVKNVVEYPRTQIPVVKYYEPGKSCYVNGTFYTKCEDRLNGTK
jgi:hypothetical protein